MSDGHGRRKPVLPVTFAAAVALAVGVTGSLLTRTGDWYQRLEKPPWQPPDWLFAPVWTAIYISVAVAGVLAWRESESRAERRNVLIAFLLNAALNVAWSFLFFRLQRPDFALIEIVVLWATIVLMMIVAGRRRALAGWLLVPYLAWVTYAVTLNLAIVRLNPG